MNSLNRTIVRRCLLAGVLSGWLAAWAGAPALDPPSPEALERARAIVDAMQRSERGPYSRIGWFCKDGTVQPARPYSCAERGGGRQHAVYSEERAELAALGFSVGTIFADLAWEDFWGGSGRQVRMRQLPFERFLVDTEDGWVLRRAQYYRGRVQVEDEQAAGRDLLLRVLDQRGWLADNFLLVREVVRTVPHSGGEDRTRNVRRASQEVAELDASFERLRVKIHTSPGAADVAATRAWVEAARRRGVGQEILAQAEQLASDLAALYSAAGRQERLQAARRVLARNAVDATAAGLLDGIDPMTPAERVSRLARVMGHVRDRVQGGAAPRDGLALIDLSLDLEAEVLSAAFEALADPRLSRRSLIELGRDLLVAVQGAGLLSARERAALDDPLSAVLRASDVDAKPYLAATDTLERAGGWSLGTVRHAFAEPLSTWPVLEPVASRFVDDLLRGSPMLPLAEVSRRLTLDAERSAGRLHRVFGQARAGMLGLNPGVATGRLRVLDETTASARPKRDEVVILPETVSELTPVAGILTLAEGNLLSHVQLLARNLGIPNATLPPSMRAELERHAGEQVMLAVSGDGSVVLELLDALPAGLAGVKLDAEPAGEPVDAPRPDLSLRAPLPLADLHAGLAGRVVGPKAANLGELARRFPGRVAPAVALPFGVFAEHVLAGPNAPKRRLDRAFARHRAGEIDAAALAAEIETVRQRVTGLRVSDKLREALLPLLESELGPDGAYGVFIRSDTNVEDLPGFTGAGLNLTVPNVVGIDKILDAIPRVWASPFTERSVAWRERLLLRPEEVYSSVLLMRSVPADKSGVMVTADIATRGAGLTVAAAWGVGGAVDGEAAETVVLRPDGSVTLIGEAKAPYRRRLREEGGVEWVSALSGSILTEDEQQQVRALATEVARVMKPERGPDGVALPWDVEFGFVEGRLTLFQIRPLVERGSARADRVVAAVAPRRQDKTMRVELDRPLNPPGAESAPAGAKEP